MLKDNNFMVIGDFDSGYNQEEEEINNEENQPNQEEEDKNNDNIPVQ